MSYVKNEVTSGGFYLEYPPGFDRKDVDPPASGWFEKQADAETEMIRLANLTNKPFIIFNLVAKCVPWHQPNSLPPTHKGTS